MLVKSKYMLYFLNVIREIDMSKKFLCILAAVSIFSFNVKAQDANEGGILSFQAKESVRKKEDTSPQVKVLPEFEKSAGKFAMNNIIDAEQVFCYEIFPSSKEHKGYTIEGFPIRGFCGILDKKTRDAITPFFFANKAAVNFDNSENCAMQPKIILRFVRGIDFTDVLFSSPCASLAVFYGGSVNIYNYTPITKEIDEIVKQMEKLHETFVSPALLNQLLPMGVVQTEQQRGLVNKVNEPVRNWEKQATEQMKKQEAEVQKQNSGWNKLKNKMN